MLTGGSQGQPSFQLIRQACGNEAGPRSKLEINSLVGLPRVRMKMSFGGHNQGQTQPLATGQVHSDKAGPRSSLEVSLKLRSNHYGPRTRTGMAELGTSVIYDITQAGPEATEWSWARV